MFDKMKRDELTMGELLSASWVIFRKNFTLIALMVLLVYIPLAIYVPTGYVDIVRRIINEVDAEAAFFQLASFILLTAIMSSLLNIIVMYLTENTINEMRENLGTLFVKGLRRYIPWLLTTILVIVILLILSLILVLPAIAVAPIILLAGHAAILRGRLGVGAIKYSKYVTEGYWKKVFWVYLFAFVTQAAFKWLLSYFSYGYAPFMIRTIITTGLVLYLNIVLTVLFLNLENMKKSALELLNALKGSTPRVACTLEEAGE